MPTIRLQVPRRRHTRRWWLPVLALSGTLVLGAIAWSASAFEGRPPAEEARALREVLRLSGGATVAEIGAGDGRITVEVARLIGPARILATELDSSLLERIAQRARGSGLSNITAVRAAEHATGLPTACCDAVFMRRVYHDLSDPAGVLTDIRRALKPGGRLVILDFEPTFLGNLLMPRRANRSGHGIAKADLLGEVGSAGFVPDGPPGRWDDAMFAAAFTKR